MVVPIATTMAEDTKDPTVFEVAAPAITPMSDDDPERKLSNGKETIELRLDPKGLPLVPQPSRFTDDPLNWPRWLKWTVLIQVSFMAFLGPYNAALVNPSLVLLSEAMSVNSKIASYSTTTGILTGGLSPFFWTPITNIYGRRPITLLATLITILGAVGSAVAPDFSTLLGTRAVCGFGFGGMMSVGTAVVNDMFFLHERGEKTGVYSIFVTNGAHVAALIGGYIGQAEGYQWDYWLGALSTALSFILAIFLFPETLFSRSSAFLLSRTRERTYCQMLWDFKGNLIPGRRLDATDFLESFYLLKYPSITVPFIYYTLAWSLINVLPALTLATLYTDIYNLSSGTIGLCLGLSLSIGSIIGELCAGHLSDVIMYRLAISHNGIRKPEHRLYLCLLSTLFMPGGLLVFGFTLDPGTPYPIPLIGLALSTFGLQIASTTLYAYISDAYPLYTAESGVLFNLGRGLSFCVGFFALPLADSIGYTGAWGVYAAVILLGALPVGALVVWGERWRNGLGEPGWKRDGG